MVGECSNGHAPVFLSWMEGVPDTARLGTTDVFTINCREWWGERFGEGATWLLEERAIFSREAMWQFIESRGYRVMEFRRFNQDGFRNLRTDWMAFTASKLDTAESLL